MPSVRVLRILVTTASIVVGLCCFSLMGCGNETSITDTDTVSLQTELAPEGIWTSDYKAALAQAKKEGKDVLMNFTGSDWCGYCIELHDKVFRFKTFSDYAAKNFVLLELDFPNDRSHITPEIQAQNAGLQEKFSVDGFPAILLTDAQGRPYARTGFAPGGPQQYVAHLTEFTNVRVKRDAAFAAAAQLSGIEKAKKLDEALKTMSPEWTFTFYEDVVQEIVNLDVDDEAGLRKEYDEQLLVSQLQMKLKGIQKLLQKTGDIDGALKKVDEIETKFADFKPARIAAVQFRLQLLQMDGRIDEIVKLADTMLADDETKQDARLPLFGAKLNALAQAEKFDAALEVADSMRQEFTENKQLATRIMIARAELLSKLKRNDEARTALQKARDLGGAELKAMVDNAEKSIFAANN